MVPTTFLGSEMLPCDSGHESDLSTKSGFYFQFFGTVLYGIVRTPSATSLTSLKSLNRISKFRVINVQYTFDSHTPPPYLCSVYAGIV